MTLSWSSISTIRMPLIDSASLCLLAANKESTTLRRKPVSCAKEVPFPSFHFNDTRMPLRVENQYQVHQTSQWSCQCNVVKVTQVSRVSSVVLRDAASHSFSKSLVPPVTATSSPYSITSTSITNSNTMAFLATNSILAHHPSKSQRSALQSSNQLQRQAAVHSSEVTLVAYSISTVTFLITTAKIMSHTNKILLRLPL